MAINPKETSSSSTEALAKNADKHAHLGLQPRYVGSVGQDEQLGDLLSRFGEGTQAVATRIRHIHDLALGIIRERSDTAWLTNPDEVEMRLAEIRDRINHFLHTAVINYEQRVAVLDSAHQSNILSAMVGTTTDLGKLSPANDPSSAGNPPLVA